MSDISSTETFYDGLAADYHLIYGDRWNEAVDRQGAALARLIRDAARARYSSARAGSAPRRSAWRGKGSR